MNITRVQRWILSSLLLTVVYCMSIGMVLSAVYSVDADRPGARFGVLVMGLLIALVGIVGVRLINERTWLTPWLLAAVIPSAIGWYAIWGQ